MKRRKKRIKTYHKYQFNFPNDRFVFRMYNSFYTLHIGKKQITTKSKITKMIKPKAIANEISVKERK